MAEGEIPDYLKESLPSAEGYEQEERRDFQIAEKAWRLGIPRDNMTNTTVCGYVSILRDLEVAYERVQLDRHGDISPTNDGAQRRDLDTQASVLYMASEMLLLDGLKDHRADLSQLKHWFDRLARRYGARVEYDRDAPDPERAPAAEGLWTGRAPDEPLPRPPWAPRDKRTWWLVPDGRYERHEREHVAALSEEAVKQGVRADVVSRDPELHTILTRLVYARRLAADTAATADLPSAPGLLPRARERRRHVAAPLTRLAVGMLEEQLRPGQLQPTRVTGALGTVGQRYGLKIV